MFETTRGTRRAAVRACTLGLVLALVSGAACSSGDGDGDQAAGDASPAETTVPQRPFATGRRTLTVVDTTRPTDAVPGKLPARPDRTIEVEVVYPAEGEPGPDPTVDVGAESTAVDDAPPAPGRFPLVVFAHGFNGLGTYFRGYAESWAREGYVVALPTFPLSQEGVSILADVANQPADVSFVIDQLTGVGSDQALADHVDAENIAVGGHSLGGATVFGVAYNSCCIDERIDATIPVAGGPLPFAGGDYEDQPATPMLLVHGGQDETVPIGVGDAMFDLAVGPVWYLRPGGGTHSGVFAGEEGRLFDDAAVAFLDAQLKGDGAALDALGAEAEASGIAEWRVKP
jgi:dienelactone hydrolase